MAPDRRIRRVEVAVFLLSALLAAVPTALLLADNDFEPTALLRVGEQSASRSFVEADFDTTVLVPVYGHDGQQFYVIARTFPDMQAADGHVDRLVYRARRVLLPALVSPAPAGPVTVWAILGVNLGAIGAAGVAVSRLARRIGASHWLGVSVALSPALLISTRASLGDALAFALAVWGVVVWRRHLWVAVVLFTLAALARETTLVVPLACLVVATNRERVRLLVPAAVYGAWVVATGTWLETTTPGQATSPLADAFRQFAAPFDAWVVLGPTSPQVVLTGLLAAGSLLAAWVLRRRLPELSWWLLADAALVAVAGTQVADDVLNYTRLVPLAVPAMALALGSGALGSGSGCRAPSSSMRAT